MSTANFVPIDQVGVTELHMCENSIFFFPVNIPMVWHMQKNNVAHRLFELHNTLSCVFIIIQTVYSIIYVYFTENDCLYIGITATDSSVFRKV